MAELRWGTATDPGRVRPGNEDSVLAVAQVFAVADGMGGHAAGEVASAVALQTIAARMGQQPASIASVTDVVRAANEAVYRRSLAEPTTRGMGTTLALVAPATGADGKDHLVVANVGDSRVYLCTDGELRQLTRDHSYVEEMLAAGQITADEARRHPHRHVVTRVVGIEPAVAVDTWLVTPEPGDRYLICSDGLVDEVTDEDIARIITAAPDPQTAADALVAAANEAGGRDNISVVVVEVLASDGHRGSDDVVPATTQATPTAEPLGGWLPHDLAHGFDANTGTDSDAAGARRRAADARRPPRPPPRSASGASSPGAPSCSRASSSACSSWRSSSSPRSDATATTSASRTTRSSCSRGGPRACSGSSPRWSRSARSTRAELTPEFQSRIAGHPTFDSSVAARRYVEQLAENQRALVADTTTTTVAAPSTTAPSTTAPSTSAVPASSVVTIAP